MTVSWWREKGMSEGELAEYIATMGREAEERAKRWAASLPKPSRERRLHNMMIRLGGCPHGRGVVEKCGQCQRENERD